MRRLPPDGWKTIALVFIVIGFIAHPEHFVQLSLELIRNRA